MKKSILSLLSLSITLYANSAHSQYDMSIPFELYYQGFKTKGFERIMVECSSGKEKNKKGISFWNKKDREARQTALENSFNRIKEAGGGDYNIEFLKSAMSKVIKETCPDVW